MNITFVLPNSAILSGVVTWSVKMANQLFGRGRHTYLIVHNLSDSHIKPKPMEGVTIIGCDSKPATEANLSDIIRYQSDYERILPSIIVPNWSPAVYATCASILSKGDKPLAALGYAHSDDASYYDLLAYYEPIISRFVAVSAEIAARLTTLIPHRRDDIAIRPYAVEVPSSLNRTYSSNEESLRLLYAGRLDENQKRVSDLIRLAEALSAKKVEFELRIAGDGPVRPALERQIQALENGIRNRVKLTGLVPYEKMPEAWTRSDICVLVSGYEGTSVAMLEGMAYGCVPVVTQVSGTREVIEPGVNGFTVKVGELAEMADVIADLATNRGKLAYVGYQAYATILNRYSYDRYVDWFLAFTKDLDGQIPRMWPGDRPLLAFQTTRYSRRLLNILKQLRLDRYGTTWVIVRRLRKLKQALGV
jgi:glycosyltransferase involved in cell wall biosynthesis